MTSQCYLREGALQTNSKCWFWKGYRNLLLVFISNHASIMYRFQYNQVLAFARNEAIVLSPLEGAVSDFSHIILKGWPWLYLHVALTSCVYLKPFRSYSTIFRWLGFQHLRLFPSSFQEIPPPKIGLLYFKHTKDTSLHQSTHFEPSCMTIGSGV